MEHFDERLEDIKALGFENHKETGVYDLPFNPDFDRFVALSRQNDLAFFTVRLKDDGPIVGYALFFLDTEILQKEVVSARQSLNFVAKEHRGVGYLFMKFCDDMLKKQGVNSVWRQSTTKLELGPVYERMGYHLVEKSYLRRL